MFAASEPFKVVVTHSNLARSVRFYRADLGTTHFAEVPVKVIGLEGTAEYEYSQGVADGSYMWVATEVNDLGEGPPSVGGGFSTKIPGVPSAVTFVPLPTSTPV